MFAIAFDTASCCSAARDRGLRRRHLRLGHPVPRRGVVDVLLRHESSDGSFSTSASRVEREVRHLVRGLGAIEIGLRAIDLFGAARTRRLVLSGLVAQLRDLEHGEQLSRLDAIADVDVDRLQKSGDLGVDIDLLKRSKFRRERQRLRQVRALVFATATVGRTGRAPAPRHAVLNNQPRTTT